MSSPSSSSSGTAGARRSSRPSRSGVLTWSAAVVTSAALYGFPYALATAFADGGGWIILLVVDVAVLAAVAALLWSPLVVLVAAVVSAVFAAITLVGASFFDTCGSSRAATIVEVAGGVLALAIGTWGVRRGPRVLWAIPVGWLVYGVWVVLSSHVIPGGSGGCFE